MANDGGHNAIKGFIVQSIAALLESIKNDDWSELAIEPISKDDNLQKVDIQWKLKDGRIRVAQVKSSRNNIAAPDAKKWASDLKKSYNKADEYILLLYAPAAGSTAGLDEHEGVKIKIAQGDIAIVEGDLAFRAIEIIEPIKNCPSASVKQALESLVGETIVHSVKGKIWTPEKLKTRLLELIDSYQQIDSIGNTNLSISLLRVIRNISHGRSEEYVCYTFTNQTNEPVPIPFWRMFWTDVKEIYNVCISKPSVGHPIEHRLIRNRFGKYTFDVDDETMIQPQKRRMIKILLQRNQLIQPVGNAPNSWFFNDSQLRTDIAPHQTDIFVIFPCKGIITASGTNNKCSQIVHWEVMSGSEHHELTAIMQVGPLTDSTNEELLANLNQNFEYFIRS